MFRLYKFLSFSILLAVAFSSCMRDQIPTASFSYTITSIVPATVAFNNNSTNGSAYHWDFGDGFVSDVQDPVHIYNSSGTYTVILTVTGPGGTATYTLPVSISPPTQVAITNIQVVYYPPSAPNNLSWDDIANGTYPDVYFTISDVNSNVLYNGTPASRLENLTSAQLPFGWDLSAGPFTITNFNFDYYIDLWDYDYPTLDSYMGYCGPFKAADYVLTHPSEVTLPAAHGVSLTLYLHWF